MNIADQVREKLLELEAAMVARVPELSSLLKIIHSQLKKDPEIVTILSEAECKILVSGLKEHTHTEFANKALKAKAKKASSMVIGIDL